MDLLDGTTVSNHHGSWAQLQPINEVYVDAAFPLDSQGNLYREGRWEYRPSADYQNADWSKPSNVSADDYSDIHALMDVLVNGTGGGDYLTRLEAVADVDQWLLWFATMTILANSETNLTTGREDDFAAYVGVNDPRLKLLPHDLDAIITGSSANPATHTLFDMVKNGDAVAALVPLFAIADVRTRYHHALRHLLGTTFSKASFNALTDNEFANWLPAADRQAIISWMDTRRAFVTGEVNTALGAPPVAAPLRLTDHLIRQSSALSASMKCSHPIGRSL
ncbi:MAG: hypothetical protein ACI9DF_006166 [Verrucomicrobiales bacterium]